MMPNSHHYSSKFMQAVLRPLILLLIAGVGLFVLVAIAAKVLFPYLEGWRQERAIAQLRAEVGKAVQEKKQLKRDITRHNTPEGPILEARRKGWIKPGDRVIRYAPLEAFKPKTARRTDPRKTTFGRWQREVERALR